MMTPGKRGPKPRSDSDPMKFVRALRGGRTDWEPAVMAAVAAWLDMMAARYAKRAAELRGKSFDLAPAVAAGMARRVEAIADAAAVLAADLGRPWSRVEWLAAVARRAAADRSAAGPHPAPPVPTRPA